MVGCDLDIGHQLDGVAAFDARRRSGLKECECEASESHVHSAADGRLLRDEGREPVELSPRLLEQTIHVGPREPALFRPVPTTNAAMPVLSRLTRCEPLTRTMKTTSTDGLRHSETSQLSR